MACRNAIKWAFKMTPNVKLWRHIARPLSYVNFKLLNILNLYAIFSRVVKRRANFFFNVSNVILFYIRNFQKFVPDKNGKAFQGKDRCFRCIIYISALFSKLPQTRKTVLWGHRVNWCWVFEFKKRKKEENRKWYV